MQFGLLGQVELILLIGVGRGIMNGDICTLSPTHVLRVGLYQFLFSDLQQKQVLDKFTWGTGIDLGIVW